MRVGGGAGSSCSSCCSVCELGAARFRTTTTASDMTAEGRAVRAYLKQPVQLRASIEAWEIDVNDITDRTEATTAGGGVERARWRNMDVVLKTVKSGTVAESQSLHQELQILTRNRHPNLVMFLGACTSTEPIQVLVEFMPGGSISGYYEDRKQQRGGKPWQPARTQLLAWTVDLFRALCFLHMSRPVVVHMNVVPSNLLLSSNMTLKLSGFGLSRSLKLRRSSEAEGFRAKDLRYCAPEVLIDRGVTEQVDVYSAGMVMYFLATGEPPFKDTKVVEKLTEEAHALAGVSVTRPPLESVKWKEYGEIMARCWQHIGKDRPTSAVLIQDLEALSVPRSSSCVPPSCSLS
mmetsp:Transcript_36114/g.90859  ORF Transcript_36114/g.90859 Transcript_36114/m.90859 type:complete len:348 (-) Transcript_36114:296-1339(-)